MILSKQDLDFYLEADRLALRKKYKRPKIFGDEIWKFQIALRKCEYYNNTKTKNLKLLCKYYYKYKLHKLSLKLNFSIPINVFSAGLSIAHYGTIVVNKNAKIGENCRIQENVTIGATGGSDKAAIISDNVFLGSGAKLIGDIFIAEGIAIGAGSVVTKSFYEKNITIAGVPAKKISNNGSVNDCISASTLIRNIKSEN